MKKHDKRKKYHFVRGRKIRNWLRWPETKEEMNWVIMDKMIRSEEFQEILYCMATQHPNYGR